MAHMHFISFSGMSVWGRHLEQGTIWQLSQAFDGILEKLIIFEPFMWLGQFQGPFLL